MLVSGTVSANIVLPKGMGVSLQVEALYPQLLVYDGPVPDGEPFGTEGLLSANGDDSLPGPMPLPSPLPANAFDHIRPEEWLDSISVPLGQKYVCEEHTLRIIVQERLYPLETLTNVRDVAQVLLDVLCDASFSFACQLPHAYADLVHRSSYEEVGILHRDPTKSNIMYRKIKGKVYGVLTDFDLSSWGGRI